MAPRAQAKSKAAISAGHPPKPPVLAGGVLDGMTVTYQSDQEFSRADSFEANLAGWLGRYVAHQSVLPLMTHASGLPEVKTYLQKAMAPLSGKWKIAMHLFWDRLSNGQWYVAGVGFSMQDNQANIARTKARALRDRLEQEARDRADAAGPPEWKIWWDLSQGSGDWLADAAEGQKLIDAQFDVAHKAAKNLVPMLANPIGPDFSDDASIGIEIGKAILGTIEGKPGSIGSGAADTWKLLDAGMKVKDNISAQDGLKAAGDVIDLGLPLIFADAGPISGMGSVILGSFIEIAIASDAARVSRERGRLYFFFVAGYLSSLAAPPIAMPMPPPRSKKGARALWYMDKGMYDLGARQSVGYSARQKYLAQLALIHYGATHNTANSWNFQNRIDLGWRYPEDYIRAWSRETLGRSFTWQFLRGKYRYK